MRSVALQVIEVRELVNHCGSGFSSANERLGGVLLWGMGAGGCFVLFWVLPRSKKSPVQLRIHDSHRVSRKTFA